MKTKAHRMPHLEKQLNDSISDPAPMPPLAGPRLTTEWAVLPAYLPVKSEVISGVSATTGECVWLTSMEGVQRWDAGMQRWHKICDGSASAIAAQSDTVAWVIFGDLYKATVARIDSDGRRHDLPPLPKQEDVPVQVSAERTDGDRDGQVWVRTFFFSVYYFDHEKRAWQAVKIPESFNVRQLAVASSDTVYAVVSTDRQGVETTAVVGHFPAGWSPMPQWPEGIEYISATADGALWGSQGEVFWVQEQAATLSRPYRVSVPPLGPLGLWSAAHRWRVCALNENRVATFREGIDRWVGRPWPRQSEAEAKAYTVLSRHFVDHPAGVRGVYTDTLKPIDQWRNELREMPCPESVDRRAFETIKAQLLDEMEAVIEIRLLFQNLRELNTALASVNALQLPAVAQLVGLQHGEKRTTQIDLGIMADLVVTTAIKYLPGDYQKAVSLVYSILRLGIAEVQGGERPPDYNLEISYADLALTLSNLYVQAGVATAKLEAALLTNAGRLQQVRTAVRKGLWQWPTKTSAELAKTTMAAYRVYFFQRLMPALWQRVYIKNWLCNRDVRPPITPLPEHVLPEHDYVSDCKKLPESEHMFMCQVWFCNGLGAETDYHKKLDPFPAKSCIQAIMDLGVKPADIFKGVGGWHRLPAPRTTSSM